MPISAVRLIVTLALGILVAPLLCAAQPSSKVPRIGYLGDTPGPLLAAFRRALREHGYVEGQNIAMEYRWVEGQHERLHDLAAEFVHSQVDVIITAGTQASRAAKHATSTIPVVIAHVGNPVETGLVASFARPGGNLTGVSLIAAELVEKQLELLKEAVPRATRVAVSGTRRIHPTDAICKRSREQHPGSAYGSIPSIFNLPKTSSAPSRPSPQNPLTDSSCSRIPTFSRISRRSWP
jgi:ABC-type uncharacterized transport system substrate-binding protein